jgi:hypothetical protein
MTNRLRQFLVLILLGFMTTSCGKEEMEESITDRIATVQEAKAVHLIFSETFESPVPLYSVHGTDFGAPHSFSVVTNPVFSGVRSARFELRDTDPMVSSGTRAEVTVVKDTVQKEMWYSFAALFPADGYAKDSQKELISQWHQTADDHLGEKSQSPATQLLIKNDRFILETGYNDQQVSKGILPESRKRIDLGPVTKDTWHKFVFHFIHSYESDGLIEIWLNDKKLLTHPGGNMYNNIAMPRWKIGIYKWKWNGEGTTDTDKRILYFDNIKVGDKKVSWSDISPATNPPATKDPTPNPIASLTFVNSHTDQDIGPLADGATLSLSALGTNKISVRANTDPAKTGCVRFELSGTKSYAYADKIMPYALFGDNGAGNYYFGDANGNAMAAGTYTLVVTPYSDTKAKGVPGEAFKVGFTIVE